MRMTCGECNAFLSDSNLEKVGDKPHKEAWIDNNCDYCGKDVNDHGYDKRETVSGSNNGWYTTYVYGVQYITWWRWMYSDKKSGNASPPPGLTWGIWYSFLRGDISQLIILEIKYNGRTYVYKNW